MSSVIEACATELLWKQWTALGVAGVATPAKQAVDLEALIAFTPFVAAVDPRLVEECVDWCARIGKGFVSISRLRQILKGMPSGPGQQGEDLPTLVLNNDFHSHRLSNKSRPPQLERPALVQLRSRFVFGVGARADIAARLALQGRVDGGQRASELRPSGYTKGAVATVLDELAQAGVLKKIARATSVRYELAKDAPLRSLLAPLPRRIPLWTERFALVAAVLDGWRTFGSRKTYAVELAKILEGVRPLAGAIGENPPCVDPTRLVAAVDRWATGLLTDEVWEDEWILDGRDIAQDILDSLSDDIVQSVHEDEYPVGLVELHDFTFRVLNEKKGTAEFVVQFTAEHAREDGFTFDGNVEGLFRFDPSAEDRHALLASVDIMSKEVHFDMGEPP